MKCGIIPEIPRVHQRKRPTDPKEMKDIPYPLPDDYSENLLYDNGNETRRILLFGSKEGLQRMCDSDQWFADGTHSTASRQFTKVKGQLFVVRVPIGKVCISVAYALLPSHKTEDYVEALTQLKTACLRFGLRPKPKVVNADFEIGIHNAFHAVFGEAVRIQGCFYHLTQSTWRQVGEQGLQKLYRSSGGEELRLLCGKLDGLALLPPADVRIGMRKLSLESPNYFDPMIQYFDENYVTGSVSLHQTETGRMMFDVTPPRYPIELWNVHDATITKGRHRTNNMAETWNNFFKNVVGHKKPSLWHCISCLDKDIMMVQGQIISYEAGDVQLKRVKQSTKNHQKRLKRLCKQYKKNEKNISQFLNAVGKCIRIDQKKPINTL